MSSPRDLSVRQERIVAGYGAVHIFPPRMSLTILKAAAATPRLPFLLRRGQDSQQEYGGPVEVDRTLRQAQQNLQLTPAAIHGSAGYAFSGGTRVTACAHSPLRRSVCGGESDGAKVVCDVGVHTIVLRETERNRARSPRQRTPVKVKP